MREGQRRDVVRNAGVEVAHRLRQRFTRKPKTAALVAEYVSPAADERRAAFAFAERHRTGAGNDDDAVVAGQGTGVRDLGIVHDRERARGQSGKSTVHTPFIAAYAGDDALELH